MTFKVGDKVKWTSQAAGITKEKLGVVVEVVPAGQRLRDCVTFEGRRSSRDFDIDCSRPDVSYLVRAKGPSGPRKLYWPRVSQLKPIEPVEPRVVVEISGGNCQNCYSNIKVGIDILDWDNLEAEEEQDMKAINEATDPDTKKALIAAFKPASEKAKEILKGVEHVW